MLVLSGRDLEAAISPEELIEAVEAAMRLYESEDFLMPPRMHADYCGDVLLLMPAFTPEAFGTKLVSVFPGNREKGVPVIQGAMILNDGKTGQPLALIDAAALTGMRTGAVAAVGVKHLSHPGAKKLGIIGAGVQAGHIVLLSDRVRSWEQIFVSDIDRTRSEGFAAQVCDGLKSGITVLETGREILENCDVVVTATTSMTPVLPGDPKILSGKTFVGIGSFKPQMREFPDELFERLDRIYIDSRQAVQESGDISQALDSGLIYEEQIKTMGSFILKPYAIPDGSTQFFKSVGMALFDLVVARKAFKKATDLNLGKTIEFP